MALSTQRVPPFSPLFSFPTTPSTYDVFLCFRGEDTRFSFTDHLHDALKQRGFIVFKDDEKLEQGKSIYEELLKAIKESQYAVIVISKTFAFSKWCLEELNRVVKCSEKTRLEVLPIFYHVDPTDIRKQKGVFAEAFDKHSKDAKVDKEQRKAWRTALTKVANISGWHVDDKSSEAAIIRKIIGRILCGLRSNKSNAFIDLVGLESRVEQLITLLCLEIDDVRAIGIHGMGGIGKTTLAKALYDIVHCYFDASCFICCSNNNGSCRIEELQEQIVCEIMGESNMKIWNPYCGIDVLRERLNNKKIFIVLDDVNFQQLDVLVGKSNLFGKGSRIVVTSRDCQFWRQFLSKIYEVQPLEDKDALQLFCCKAFKKSHPENNFEELSAAIIRLVKGLPLALEVIGSLLFGEKKDMWNGVLDALKVCSIDKIRDKLKISYHSLEDSEKKMFLDIACFFSGMSNMKVLPIFESLDYHPNFHFEVLKNKSLIKISEEGIIWMHDLFRTMGQQIIYQLSPMEPGNRSRLWCNKDIIHVFKNNSGTNAVEGIVFPSRVPRHESLSFEALSRMRRLIVLIISDHFNPYITWVGNPSKLILSNELRIIKWPGFPLKSLPTSFQPDNLFELFVPYSNIEVLQLGRKTFDRLKCINLSVSPRLTKITDLSEVPNLEILCLNYCCHLRKIHPSFGTLKKLLILDLGYCRSFKRLPEKVCWESLEVLNLTNCSKLENVPENVGNIISLKTLKLDSTCIKVPLSWMKSLSFLRDLAIGDRRKTLSHHFCQFIDSHSHSVSCLYWLSSSNLLEELDLSYRNLLDREIPNISCLSSLRKLDLSGNRFTKISEGICQLPNLQDLNLSECEHLQSLSTSLPLSFSFLSTLKLNGCNLLDEMILNGFSLLSSARFLELSKNKFTTLPYCFYLFSNLWKLKLCHCSQLCALPKLPLGLRELRIKNCPSLEISCYHTGMRMLQLCSSQWFSVTVSTCHEYDGKLYKILQLNPQLILNEAEYYNFYDGDMFAWGPTLGSEIPEWFNHSSTNRFHVDMDLEELIEGFALFVAYQVHEDENSNGSIFGSSNPTFPEFVWRFQASDICQELPLVFCVPEVPLVGRNGFWAYIPVELFKKKGMDLDRCRYLETSVGTSSSDVEVKECGIRLLHRHDSSQFFELLRCITPPGLDFKNPWDFYLWLKAGVH